MQKLSSSLLPLWCDTKAWCDTPSVDSPTEPSPSSYNDESKIHLVHYPFTKPLPHFGIWHCAYTPPANAARLHCNYPCANHVCGHLPGLETTSEYPLQVFPLSISTCLLILKQLKKQRQTMIYGDNQ